jgi:hypothetical protein
MRWCRRIDKEVYRGRRKRRFVGVRGGVLWKVWKERNRLRDK